MDLNLNPNPNLELEYLGIHQPRLYTRGSNGKGSEKIGW